ncbi:MAG: FAD-dependent oxidoreductase [Butyrivibrio sp.]|nr:FAD-dependent oxidoreductase [Acetatifactor muris]MCM1560524.1 FAD-dependent oxidoreductase [Butyrivibrio sp.]
MLRVNQVKIRTEHTEEQLRKKAAELLHIPVCEILEMKIVRQSIDARQKPEIFYSYSLDIKVKNEDRILHRFRGRENQVSRKPQDSYVFPKPGEKRLERPVVIVGMGPAGLFCGYFLALHGYRPILLERGKCVEERQRDVEEFWKTGRLNTESNVQFGEGGAGTFSDGKLNTLVKDRNGRNGVVLETLVKFGAKESICYEAKPHVGTDVLRKVVRNLRNEIVRLGGEVRFQSLVTDIEIQNGGVAGVVINHRERLACSRLVLAVGHSARDTFSMLYEKGVPMEAKAFAVGLRVEHPQSMINESQYGMKDPGRLGAAPYKVAAKGRNGRGVYSFCMCPGGYVVNASSEEGRTAVNGMSYSGRNGVNANSAVIVAVTPEDFGSTHPLAGVAFQRRLEEKAFALGQGKIPVQRYGEFKKRVAENAGTEQPDIQPGNRLPEPVLPEGESPVEPQCKGEYVWADLSGLLPVECSRAFIDGMESFGRQIRGFDRPDAVLLGVESRTSSPVRIGRDETLQSEIRGLYPCGEGAGYAGGITSAAMDGLRVAEQIAADIESRRIS